MCLYLFTFESPEIFQTRLVNLSLKSKVPTEPYNNLWERGNYWRQNLANGQRVKYLLATSDEVDFQRLAGSGQTDLGLTVNH